MKKYIGKQGYITCYCGDLEVLKVMNQNKERVELFDVCKGILIILVVLGHVMPENVDIHKWIYSWHIPGFFMVSGVLLKYTHYGERSLKKVLFNGISRLIIPYFAYSCLLLFARWGASGFDIGVLRWQIMDLCLLCGIGATWFLPCLFIAQLIYVKVESISNVFMILMASGLFVIPCVVDADNFMAFVLFRALIAIFFLVIGTIIQCGLFKFINSNIWTQGIICIMLCVLSVFVFVTTGSNVAALNVLKFGRYSLYIMNALIGCAMMFAISVFVVKINCNALKEIIAFYGKESLIIMGTHQVIMLVLRIPNSNSIWLNIVFCVVVLLAELPVIYWVKRLRKIVRKNFGVKEWKTKPVRFN